jgi:integrase
MHYLTEQQIKRVLEASKDSSYYYLAIWTGMRRSELLGLRWGDIQNLTVRVNQVAHQLEGGEMVYTEPETASSKRTQDIHPRAALMLQEYKQWKESLRITCNNSDIVFSDPDGTEFRPNTLTRNFF